MLNELLLYIDLSGVMLVAKKLIALERAIALGNPHLALDLDLPDMLLDMGMIPDQQPFNCSLFPSGIIYRFRVNNWRCVFISDWRI